VLICAECDSCYGLVTLELVKLAELATNMSTIADSVIPYNSTTNTNTFYDRLLQTRITVEDLSLVNCFCCILIAARCGCK